MATPTKARAAAKPAVKPAPAPTKPDVKRAPARPKLAVWKFASCDGCQLSLLDCEDELLTVAAAVDIAYFPEATSRMVKGPYALSLVEGSITTPHDAERIHQIRRASKLLITIGSCATAGGIQALRNTADVADLARATYASPELLKFLRTSTPIADHVKVDFELPGCPVNRHQLLDVVGAVLHGRRPQVSAHAVCIDCKMRQLTCVMVSPGVPCMGPVTHAGCGALCPSYHRGCYGCFGPSEAPRTVQVAAVWQAHGTSKRDVARAFRSFASDSDVFRAEAEAHER